MPIYTHDCDDCGDEVEVICPADERDRARMHSEEVEGSGCGGALVRRGVESFTAGEPSYQPGAINSAGEHVPGHFGKDAPRKKPRWHRP